MGANVKAPGVRAPGASPLTLSRNDQEATERTEVVTNSFALSSSEGTTSKQKQGVFPAIRAREGGLWRDHLATPKQSKLVFTAGNRKATQADVLIELLRQARYEKRALELPEIMAVGIAQHGTRFNEIRKRGFDVQNEQERDEHGRVLSRYFLVHDPETDAL
ncbi:MAG TPA: hypothetical protein VN622_02145 [Clostridia bacterium]|nr:hypothetical protein [Clostridia bacterium]